MDAQEVHELIAQTKREENSWKAFERLAALCAVRAELEGEQKARGVSFADVPRSEFARAAEAAPFERLITVLDEHFDCIRELFPKEYATVIKRLTTF